MATNHKPTVQGTDHGIWRRLKLIPFIKTIAPENQDKYLEEKLLVELPGILNYLIEGSVRWFNEGLKTPDAISKATSDYRNEMDVMGNFIRECCTESTDNTIKARELFRVYQQWCEQNNEHACSERILSTSLKEMGYKQKRLSDGRYWQDIKLNTTL